MNKLLAILLIALSATGCDTIHQSELHKAEYFCESRGGASHLTASVMLPNNVYCMDGSRANIYKVELPVGYFDNE